MTDFYPTLAELADLEIPSHVQGVSLVPALNEPTARPRKDSLTQLTVRANGYSLRDERYRITEWHEEEGGHSVELYDHQTDPEEMINHAGKPELADLQNRLLARLRERVKAAQVVPDGIEQISDFTRAKHPRWDYQLPLKSEYNK